MRTQNRAEIAEWGEAELQALTRSFAGTVDELGTRLAHLEDQLEQQVETEHVLREEHAETQRQLQRAKEKALRKEAKHAAAEERARAEAAATWAQLQQPAAPQPLVVRPPSELLQPQPSQQPPQ